MTCRAAGGRGRRVRWSAIGATIRAGDPLFDIVDPLTDAITTVSSSTDGVFYMRRAIRFVTAGAPLGRVTGTVPVRKGMLLGACAAGRHADRKAPCNFVLVKLTRLCRVTKLVGAGFAPPSVRRTLQ